MSYDELRRLAHATVFPAIGAPTPPDWVLRRIEQGIGGFVVFGADIQSIAQLAQLTGDLHSARAGLVLAIDEESGDVSRLHIDPAAPYPGNRALGQLNDLAVTEKVARQIGLELAEVGIDLDLAPAVDTLVNPLSPNGVRCFGSDRRLVGAHSAAWIRGLQSTGVAACAKHYPGHGLTVADAHLASPVIPLDRDEVAGEYLIPFRRSIEASVASIMVSHPRVPAFGPEPASLSYPLLTEVLRGQLGFDGLVMTDALDMAGVTNYAALPEAAVLAIAAGADALCLGAASYDSHTQIVVDALCAAMESGALSEERLRQAAGRVAALGSRPAAVARSAADPELGLEVARRALAVRGDVGVGRRPLMVVRFAPTASLAIGAVPWGPAPALRRLGAPATETVFSGAPSADDVARLAVGPDPLVIVTRSAHRDQWQRDGLLALLAARPDAVVVEMGIPGMGDLPARGVIATFGAAECCATAAAEVLVAA